MAAARTAKAITPMPLSNTRSAWKPAVTVATVVADGAGRYLIVEEIVRGRRRYNQPAGHLEAGETLLAAARRETREETAWEVELLGVVGIYQWLRQAEDGEPEQVLRFTFAARALRRHPGPLDDGIVAAHWLRRETLAEHAGLLRSPLVLRSIDDFETRGFRPLDLISSLGLGHD